MILTGGFPPPYIPIHTDPEFCSQERWRGRVLQNMKAVEPGILQSQECGRTGECRSQSTAEHEVQQSPEKWIRRVL